MFKYFFKLITPPHITFGPTSYHFISNFLLAKKMQIVSSDVNMVAISRGES